MGWEEDMTIEDDLAKLELAKRNVEKDYAEGKLTKEQYEELWDEIREKEIAVHKKIIDGHDKVGNEGWDIREKKNEQSTS
jgi:hypothetical protein